MFAGSPYRAALLANVAFRTDRTFTAIARVAPTTVLRYFAMKEWSSVPLRWRPEHA